MHITPENIKLYADKAKQMLVLAEAMAKLTSTPIDDQIVAALKNVVAITERHIYEPWLVGRLDWLFHLLTGSEHEVEAKLKALDAEAT